MDDFVVEDEDFEVVSFEVVLVIVFADDVDFTLVIVVEVVRLYAKVD